MDGGVTVCDSVDSNLLHKLRQNHSLPIISQTNEGRIRLFLVTLNASGALWWTEPL